jgi:hypothetical protein
VRERREKPERERSHSQIHVLSILPRKKRWFLKRVFQNGVWIRILYDEKGQRLVLFEIQARISFLLSLAMPIGNFDSVNPGY